MGCEDWIMQISEAVLSTSAEAPLLHVNRKWTFCMQKTLRKTNLFAGKKAHFRLTCVAQKRLLWVFDQVLYWHLCIISISQQSLFFFSPKGNNVGYIKCPDGGLCGNRQTCCYLASHRSYGCCDKPRAVCCRGKLEGMCCSHGYR